MCSKYVEIHSAPLAQCCAQSDKGIWLNFLDSLKGPKAAVARNQAKTFHVENLVVTFS